jgi:hypothetical protein
MSATPIYLVMDAGSPVSAFMSKHELKVYLRRRLDVFVNPLVYTFGGEGYAPTIMTMSRALGESSTLYLDEYGGFGHSRGRARSSIPLSHAPSGPRASCGQHETPRVQVFKTPPKDRLPWGVGGPSLPVSECLCDSPLYEKPSLPSRLLSSGRAAYIARC